MLLVPCLEGGMVIRYVISLCVDFWFGVDLVVLHGCFHNDLFGVCANAVARITSMSLKL